MRFVGFRGSRWRFHLRGSGRAFSSSGLARGVSRSASAYDSARSKLELWRHRHLSTQCASLRGSGRGFCSSGRLRGVSRSASAYHSARLEHEFSVRFRFPMQFVCASLRGVFMVVLMTFSRAEIAPDFVCRPLRVILHARGSSFRKSKLELSLRYRRRLKFVCASLRGESLKNKRRFLVAFYEAGSRDGPCELFYTRKTRTFVFLTFVAP